MDSSSTVVRSTNDKHESERKIDSHFNLLSYFVINQCRKHNLLLNDRTTILTRADELQILQFCINSGNKLDEYQKTKKEIFDFEKKINDKIIKDIKSAIDEAERNCVIEKLSEDNLNADVTPCKSQELKNITASQTLNQISNSSNDFYNDVVDAVDTFKALSNHANILDVFLKFILELCKEETGLKQEIRNINKDVFGKLSIQKDINLPVQKHILKFLFNIAGIDLLTCEKTNYFDMDTAEDTPVNDEVQLTPKTPQRLMGTPKIKHVIPVSPSTPETQSERQLFQRVFVHDILRSYLHLLVNTRSQIALARIFNIPERGLNHEAFTHLKHEAKKSGLSLYQELSSFILRLRMGGKMYEPSADNPLKNCVKGLSSLLELIQKLETIIEEDPDVTSACRRVVNIVKNNLIQCKSGRFPRNVVEPVANDILDVLKVLINETKSTLSSCDQLEVSSGGSVLGRETVVIICSFLDSSAITVSQMSSQFMRDVRFSSDTPTRFPCLLTQFQSPSTLGDFEELMDSKETNKTGDIVRRSEPFVSSALYVQQEPGLDLELSPKTLNSIEVLPCKTIVQPRESGTDALQNITSKKGGKTKTDCFEKNSNLDTDMECEKKLLKRRSDDLQPDQNKEPLKKSVKSSSSSSGPRNTEFGKKEEKTSDSVSHCTKANKKKMESKSCRRKLLPQVKGQGKITGFFKK